MFLLIGHARWVRIFGFLQKNLEIFGLVMWKKKVKITLSVCSASCFWKTWCILGFISLTFQLQASEALRNSSHSCTAADLLQAKQQILTHQQQLEEQECLLKSYQKKTEEFEEQITRLQEKITTYELVCSLW